MYFNKRIVVAPLFWGLGHATRCIPIIKSLQKNNTVAIASDGEALTLLQAEFPELESFELPAYSIRYTFDSMLANMIVLGPGSLRTIRKEKNRAEEIVQNWKADILISDNRFGFRSGFTENIYITHQLNIPANNRVISNLASRVHQRIIAKFDQCWVPDFKGSKNLAGKLSQVNIQTPTKYLGALSRMQKATIPIEFDFTAVLSGPEPQRTKLEEIILKAFSQFEAHRFCLVRGTNSKRNSESIPSNVRVYNLLASADLNKVINSTTHIICRSGYTSIMDLVLLNKEATLIPTPGQYEQEYLAKRLDGKYRFQVCHQKTSLHFLAILFSRKEEEE
ncbi:MAG: glycosyltransferase [Saprospiraceae bacterium]|nr:glycosyltransferase [Saprospiraceae bacterium]